MYEWLTIKDKNDIGEIYIYGEITPEKFFDEDVTPTEIQEQVAKLKGKKEINMYINSPGGSVFSGIAIYNILKRFSSPVTATIDGLAASIASVIMLAADKVLIPESAMIMIHNPVGVAAGEAEEMRRTADLLDKVKNTIVDVYMKKSTLPENKLKKMMDNETWMTGKEAVEFGFADQLKNDTVEMLLKNNSVIFNGLSFDISKFKSFPINRILAENKRKEEYKTLKERFNRLKNEMISK